MSRTHYLRALGLAAIASLIACSDTSQPVDPLAGITARSGQPNLTCIPATPDSLIPLPVSPRSQRVDLGTPVFTDPANVSNPLFPVGRLDHVVLVGNSDGREFRAETSLLPGTQLIDLGDRVVETRISQYVAYADRRIIETAIDWYAQDDNGAVWYFGEDVFNYDEGKIVDTHGTWLACRDAPVAMIMPADPQVGNVYRVEDKYPLVFEEIEIQHTGQTVAGPLGPVAGAFTVQQLHLDGSYAPKTFAPGYGEFSTGSGTDFEALAIALPTDAAGVPTPIELRQLLQGSRRVFHAAGAGNWGLATQTLGVMNRDWSRYRSGTIPILLRPLVSQALDELSGAVAGRQRAESRQFALDVTKYGLDLLLQYRSRADVDFGRLDLWSRQLVIDAEADDAGGIASDLAIMGRILDRLGTGGDQRERADVRMVHDQIGDLRAAAQRRASPEVMTGAGRLQRLLDNRVREQEE